MKKERTTNCPDASGWTHSGLLKMIGWAGGAAREFAPPLAHDPDHDQEQEQEDFENLGLSAAEQAS
jgi:hypothetical protein